MPITSKRFEADSIAELLNRLFETLTPKEKKPARVLLDNYPMVGLETVAQFAEHAGVSGPTILRFVSKLGFNGYADFQNHLRSELEARLKSPLQKTIVGRRSTGKMDDLIHRFSDQVCENINRSMENIPTSEIKAVIKLIGDVRRSLFLLGGRYSGVMAYHFYLHLHAIRPNLQHIVGQSATWPEYLLDVKKNDVLIIFDIRRYQADLLSLAKLAKERGALVVLFTDQWLSPISHVAKHVFSLRIKVPSAWDSSAAMLTLLDIILAQVTSDLSPGVTDRLEEKERIFKQLIH